MNQNFDFRHSIPIIPMSLNLIMDEIATPQQKTKFG